MIYKCGLCEKKLKGLNYVLIFGSNIIMCDDCTKIIKDRRKQ